MHLNDRLLSNQICTLKVSELKKKNSAILKVTYLSVLTFVCAVYTCWIHVSKSLLSDIPQSIYTFTPRLELHHF